MGSSKVRRKQNKYDNTYLESPEVMPLGDRQVKKQVLGRAGLIRNKKEMQWSIR